MHVSPNILGTMGPLKEYSTPLSGGFKVFHCLIYSVVLYALYPSTINIFAVAHIHVLPEYFHECDLAQDTHGRYLSDELASAKALKYQNAVLNGTTLESGNIYPSVLSSIRVPENGITTKTTDPILPPAKKVQVAAQVDLSDQPGSILNAFYSLFSALSLIFVTELGDRTFFLAAILSIKYPKRIVFSATCAALFIMSGVSSIGGYALRSVPIFTSSLVTTTTVALIAAALMFVFGFVHLYHAFSETVEPSSEDVQLSGPRPENRINLNENEDTILASSKYGETMASSSENGKTNYTTALDDKGETQSSHENELYNSSSGNQMMSGQQAREKYQRYNSALSEDNTSIADLNSICNESCGELKMNFNEAQNDADRIQFSRMGLHPDSFKVFREVFLAIFVSEWGDKSMFATVSLATVQEPWGVFLGSCIGHGIVTIIGIFCGIVLKRWMNHKALNISAGLLFIGFGIAALFDVFY